MKFQVPNSNSRWMPTIFFFAALLAYIPGVWWGAPEGSLEVGTQRWSWGPDDETPLGPLIQLHGVITHTVDRRNPGYPLMHPFLVGAAYIPYLTYLRLAGKLISVHAAYPFGLADPVSALRILTYISHLISALMGAGIVAAAFYTGRLLWNIRVGILTATFVLVSYPMFYYARNGNVDVPMLFFVALSLACFARILKEGVNTRQAIIMGICVGCALATKEQAIGMFLAFPIVLLPLRWLQTRNSARWYGWAYWKPFAVVGIVALVAFGLGSGLFVDPKYYFAHYRFQQERLRLALSGEIVWIHPLPNTLEGNFQLAKLLLGYLINTMTLVGVVLAGVGLLWSVVKERSVSLFVLPVVSYVMVLSLMHFPQLRYTLPAAYVLSFFAARAVFIFVDSRYTALRMVGGISALIVICMNLLSGVNLTYLMIKDSRYAAGRWLQMHAFAGNHIEYFGMPRGYPAIAEGITLEPAIPLYFSRNPPRIEENAVQQTLQGWKKRKPDFIIVMPDQMGKPGMLYSLTCPTDIYEGLLEGRFGYHLAAYFETPALISWIGRPVLDYPSVNPPIRIFMPTK